MVAAVVRSLEAAAIDDALDPFALLMQVKLISSAKRATNNDRLSTLPRLEKASRLVAAVWRVLGKETGLAEDHGTDLDGAALWQAVESVAPREEANAAAATVEELVPPGDDAAEAAVRATGLPVQHGAPVPDPARGIEGARGRIGRAPGAGCRAEAARAVAAPSEGQAAAAERDGQQAGAAGLAAAGVQQREPPNRGGGPRRVRGVRAGTALPRASAPGRVRVAVEPVVRSAGTAAGHATVLWTTRCLDAAVDHGPCRPRSGSTTSWTRTWPGSPR